MPGVGINEKTAAGIAALLLRDLKRGYTYDHSCRKIRMTYRLFVRRLNYLIALARKHYRKGLRFVRDLVDFVLIHGRLPRNITVPLMGRASRHVASSLRRFGKVRVYGRKIPARVISKIAPKLLRR